MGASTFTVDQTHGILQRPEHQLGASSANLGWASLYASTQREGAYADHYDAIEDHLIVVHLDGPVRVARDLSGDRVNRTVQPGGLFILPARRDFGVRLDGGLTTIHLYVRDRYIRDAAQALVAGDPDLAEIAPKLGERDELIEQVAHLALQLVRNGVQGDWCAESLARTIAAQLVRNHSTARLAAHSPEEQLSSHRLMRLEEFIESRLADPISISDMAAVVSLSPVHFGRQYKKATGRTPHQHLMSARVQRAKRLLRSDMPIAQIAFDSGFCHQEHLTRVFGRLTGMTPATYRKSLRC